MKGKEWEGREEGKGLHSVLGTLNLIRPCPNNINIDSNPGGPGQ